MLKTAFWKNAARSLPATVRERYMAHLESAERWELALDAVVDGYKALIRQFHALRRSHAH
jgi:hypothetical protein